MAKKVLYATGFFEIGDMFTDKNGNPHVITDVLVCHYLKDGAYKVLYEVDSSGIFDEIVLRKADNPSQADAYQWQNEMQGKGKSKSSIIYMNEQKSAKE